MSSEEEEDSESEKEEEEDDQASESTVTTVTHALRLVANLCPTQIYPPRLGLGPGWCALIDSQDDSEMTRRALARADAGN